MQVAQGFYLLMLEGSQHGGIFPVSETEMTIGAEPADIRVPNTDITCTIYIKDKLPYIKASAEGAMLDEISFCEETIFPIKGYLKIGGAIFQLEYRSDPDTEIEEEMFLAATTDPVTGALNQREFQDRAKAEVAFATRHHHPITMVFLDIDFLASINECFGFEIGNLCLRLIAEKLDKEKRLEDILAKLNQPWLVLLLRENNLKQAEIFAERIRKEVSEIELTSEHGIDIALTVSIGICSCADGHSLTYENIARQAEEALMQAKYHGRNRIHSIDYQRII